MEFIGKLIVLILIIPFLLVIGLICLIGFILICMIPLIGPFLGAIVAFFVLFIIVTFFNSVLR